MAMHSSLWETQEWIVLLSEMKILGVGGKLRSEEGVELFFDEFTDKVEWLVPLPWNLMASARAPRKFTMIRIIRIFSGDSHALPP